MQGKKHTGPRRRFPPHPRHQGGVELGGLYGLDGIKAFRFKILRMPVGNTNSILGRHGMLISLVLIRKTGRLSHCNDTRKMDDPIPGSFEKKISLPFQ